MGEWSYWTRTFLSADLKNMRERTYEEDVDGVSLVVVTELDSMNAVEEDDEVRVVAELKASYFVVGDVNT